MAYAKFEALPTQFVDVNGAPISGGSLTFYLTGTSTEAAVYSDSAGTALATGAVTLNSRGTFQTAGGTPVEVYGDTDVVYDATLKDSAGATVDTYDDLYPGVLSLKKDLADSSTVSVGDALVAYKRSASGSVAATLHDWHEWQAINVFDYMTSAQRSDVLSGALAEDVTAAVQSAIDSVSQGVAIYFPPGNYKITDTLSITKALKFVGIGTKNFDTTANGPNIVATSAIASAQAVVQFAGVRGAVWDGISIDISSATDGAIGMRVAGCWFADYKNFEVISSAGSSKKGIYVHSYVTGTFWGSWKNVNVDMPGGGNTWEFDGDADPLSGGGGGNGFVNQQHFVQCRGSNATNGFVLDNCGGGFILENCQAEGGTGSCIVATNHVANASITVIGGEYNGYATGFDGPIFGINANMLAAVTTKYTNGACNLRSQRTASNYQIEHGGSEEGAITLKSDSESSLEGGMIAKTTSAIPASTATAVLLIQVGGATDFGSCMVSLYTFNDSGSHPQRNTRGLYHVSWRGTGSAAIVTVNESSETAITSYAVAAAYNAGTGALEVTVTHAEAVGNNTVKVIALGCGVMSSGYV